jgi:hypothetical protein
MPVTPSSRPPKLSSGGVSAMARRSCAFVDLRRWKQKKAFGRLGAGVDLAILTYLKASVATMTGGLEGIRTCPLVPSARKLPSAKKRAEKPAGVALKMSVE